MTMLQVNDLFMFMGKQPGTKLGMGFGKRPFPIANIQEPEE